MRYTLFTLAGLSTIVHGIQRARSFARRDISQPNIQAQSLDTIDTPESYSGITFDKDTGTYSFDVGSTALALSNANQQAGGLVSGPIPADYGMINTAFQPPAVSYSDALNSYQPPVFTVTPCSSANNYAANGCSPGSPLYNLNLDKPIGATR